jgi:hypothetical protein
MKGLMILGVVLILLGVAGLVFQGITYTTQENFLGIFTYEKEKTIPVPAIVGGLCLAAGIALVVVSARRQ